MALMASRPIQHYTLVSNSLATISVLKPNESMLSSIGDPSLRVLNEYIRPSPKVSPLLTDFVDCCHQKIDVILERTLQPYGTVLMPPISIVLLIRMQNWVYCKKEKDTEKTLPRMPRPSLSAKVAWKLYQYRDQIIIVSVFLPNSKHVSYSIQRSLLNVDVDVQELNDERTRYEKKERWVKEYIGSQIN